MTPAANIIRLALSKKTSATMAPVLMPLARRRCDGVLHLARVISRSFSSVERLARLRKQGRAGSRQTAAAPAGGLTVASAFVKTTAAKASTDRNAMMELMASSGSTAVKPRYIA